MAPFDCPSGSLGKLSLEQAIVSCLRSPEFATKIRSFLKEYVNQSNIPFIHEVSQHGEVGFLIRELVNTAAVHRLVVDVGARGRCRSNSYDLVTQFGWKGILIEANPRLIPQIRQDFLRADVEILNCAVSDYTGQGEFFFGINDDVSSLNRHAVEQWGSLQGMATVPVERLGNLLIKHGVPSDFDLLSLDIEGEDIKVLNDLMDNFQFVPKFIIVEVPPIPTSTLSDLPFSARTITRYTISKRIGPNLILKRI